MVKMYKEVGETLHNAIREIQSSQVPISGYLAQYCGFMPSICKRNMIVAIAKRKMRKVGLASDGCQVVEVSWGYKAHLQRHRPNSCYVR